MTISSISNNMMADSYRKMSTALKINSAKDDAAGLAIAEKLEAQINGLSKGIENTLDMQNLVNTAEGGLNNINDSLLRIRELSLQASNGILTDSDKSLIQEEISQLTAGIKDVASNTEFNGKKLLDGSFQNMHTASNADGSGADISISNSLDIAIDNYDVTGDFDISEIDSAINFINTERSKLGAMSNRFDYTIGSNEVSLLNQAAAKSRIVDLDFSKESIELNKSRVLQQYQIASVKRQQEQMNKPLQFFG